MTPKRDFRFFILKYPATTYCLLAFSLTWGLKLLYFAVKTHYGIPAFNFGLLASYGPSMAALVLIAVTEGREGLHRTLNKLVDYHAGFGWLLVAALFETVIFLGITLVYWLVFQEFPATFRGILLPDIMSLIATFIFGVFFWGLSEEIGWRGWMLPKLQSRLSPLTASLILAIVASLWHMNPASFNTSLVPQAGEYIYGYFPAIVERLLISIPFTLVITYIFNRTNGSLLVMMFFHSGSNTGYFWIDRVFGVVKEDLFRILFAVALTVIAVVFTILLLRQRSKITS